MNKGEIELEKYNSVSESIGMNVDILNPNTSGAFCFSSLKQLLGEKKKKIQCTENES